MPSNLDGNILSRQGNDESRNFLFQMKILAAIGCFLILLYSLRYSTSVQILRILGVGMLVAGAALLSGFLLGFIFAIPRVGDKKGRTTTTTPDGAQARDSGAQHDSVPFNANLVEISDWLTKIIVGVGLVELHSIPGKLGELSYYLASGLQPAPCAGCATGAECLFVGQATGLAILIFYSTLGFLMGYVWTMIYFQRDLKWQVEQLEQQKDTLQRYKLSANLLLSAEAYIGANQLDKAMATIGEALKNDPQNGIFVMMKARILKRQAVKSEPPDKDKLKQALAYASQAIALLPDKGEPLYNKACYQTLLDAKGLKSDALENLKSAFRLNPSLRQVAKDDYDLAPLKQDADFIKLIGQD
ncbi:MAG: tetratricopeptide repeat protein [Terracidiphilus sp.]